MSKQPRSWPRAASRPVLLLSLFLAITSIALTQPGKSGSVGIRFAGILNPQEPDTAMVRELAETALAALDRQYLASYPALAAQLGQLELSLVLMSEPRGLVVQAKRRDGQTDQLNLFYQDRSDLEKLLAPAFFGVWANLAGLGAVWHGEAPAPTVELNLARSLPFFGIGSLPTVWFGSIAALPEGGVFVAGLGFLAGLNADLSVRAVERPDASAAYTTFYSLAATPAGDLLALASSGESWQLKRGASLVRGTSIQPLPTSIAARPDGAILYYDANAKSLVAVQGRRRTPVQLSGAQPYYIYNVAFDADGNFWLYDQVSGMAKNYDPDGRLLGAIRLLPHADMPQGLYNIHIRGSEILLSSQSGLMAWDRHGLPLWTMAAPPSQADPAQLSSLQSVAVDGHGALYLLLTGGPTLLRLDDSRSLAALAAAHGPVLPAWLDTFAKLNRSVLTDPDSVSAYISRAELALEAGLTTVEYTLRRAMQEIFPEERANNLRLAGMQHELERSALLKEIEQVYQPLRTYGAESARAAFQQVLLRFERYQVDYPDDSQMRQQMAILVQTFRAREAGTDAAARQKLEVSLQFDPVFPAFLERYRTVPVGRVRIYNPGPLTVRDFSAQLSIKDFLDFPLRLDHTGTLAPGASLEWPLPLRFNRSLLEVREQLLAPVRLQLESADGSVSGETLADLRILSRSALTWTDTAALAAFVTPNDEAIITFTHASVAYDAPALFGRNFSKAFAIVTALGARGLAYVEDPQSPFAGGSLAASAVDTVRFPRFTLQSGAGDCDDTTALLASCLEAAGVPTAIVTTPGHVLLAFKADGPPQGNGRYQSAQYGALELEGEYWIPLESTILGKGFAEVWLSGWREVSKAGNQAELLPLATARAEYPAIPLGSVPQNPPLPAAATWQQVAGTALKAMAGHWLPALSAQASGRELNDLAVRQLQFGLIEEAIESLRLAIARDGELAAARVNLALLLDKTGRTGEARELLSRALVQFPDSRVLQSAARRFGLQTTGGSAVVEGSATPANQAQAAAGTSGAGGVAREDTQSGSRASSAATGFEAAWSDGTE